MSYQIHLACNKIFIKLDEIITCLMSTTNELIEKDEEKKLDWNLLVDILFFFSFPFFFYYRQFSFLFFFFFFFSLLLLACSIIQ